MFAELRELLCSGAIRRHQLGAKYLLPPTSFDLWLLFHSGNRWKKRQLFAIIKVSGNKTRLGGFYMIRSSKERLLWAQFDALQLGSGWDEEDI